MKTNKLSFFYALAACMATFGAYAQPEPGDWYNQNVKPMGYVYVTKVDGGSNGFYFILVKRSGPKTVLIRDEAQVDQINPNGGVPGSIPIHWRSSVYEDKFDCADMTGTEGNRIFYSQNNLNGTSQSIVHGDDNIEDLSESPTATSGPGPIHIIFKAICKY